MLAVTAIKMIIPTRPVGSALRNTIHQLAGKWNLRSQAEGERRGRRISMSLANWPFWKGTSSSHSTARKWARQVEGCTKLLKQIGYKWAHVPPFEFLSLKHPKAESDVLVSSESLEIPLVRDLNQDWHSDYEEMHITGYLGNFCKQLHPRIEVWPKGRLPVGSV